MFRIDKVYAFNKLFPTSKIIKSNYKVCITYRERCFLTSLSAFKHCKEVTSILVMELKNLFWNSNEEGLEFG